MSCASFVCLAFPQTTRQNFHSPATNAYHHAYLPSHPGSTRPFCLPILLLFPPPTRHLPTERPSPPILPFLSSPSQFFVDGLDNLFILASLSCVELWPSYRWPWSSCKRRTHLFHSSSHLLFLLLTPHFNFLILESRQFLLYAYLALLYSFSRDGSFYIFVSLCFCFLPHSLFWQLVLCLLCVRL